MKHHDLKSMSVGQLWFLHELVASVLARKILAERGRLDQRLRQLVEPDTEPANVKKIPHARRPYPQVFPKYRNPAQPSETWAGRGKQPRWLTAQLRSGKLLDDFRIKPPSDRARRRNGRANRKMPEGGLNRSA
jgi:DNA-binding protein H-NS